jgi:hypothetical protein
MALRYPSPRVQLGMSNSQRNLDEAKANIQIQKTGAMGDFFAEIHARF